MKLSYADHVALSRFHGIMFHYFSDEKSHPPSQGSMTADDLEAMISYIGREKILSADEWMSGVRAGTVRDDEVCFTFDDSLRCQMEVALPVLEKHSITGFFFVYSSVLEGAVGWLEVFRDFRHTRFASMDDFYDAFELELRQTSIAEECKLAIGSRSAEIHMMGHPWLTRRDRVFRYVRDVVLKTERYNEVMKKMMASHDFDVTACSRRLWMTKEDISYLARTGHVVGLHSHSHPTHLKSLAKEQQEEEYVKNRGVLQPLVSRKINTLSHPSNSYGSETLDILQSMGIEVGFRANMARGNWSLLEIPREDQSILMRAIKQYKD